MRARNTIVLFLVSVCLQAQTFSGVKLNTILPSDFNFTIVKDVVLKTNGEILLHWTFDGRDQIFTKSSPQRYELIQYFTDSVVYLSADFQDGYCVKVSKVVKDAKGGFMDATIMEPKPVKTLVAWGHLISLSKEVKQNWETNPYDLCVILGKDCVALEKTKAYQEEKSGKDIGMVQLNESEIAFFYGNQLGYVWDELIGKKTQSKARSVLEVRYINGDSKEESCPVIVPFGL